MMSPYSARHSQARAMKASRPIASRVRPSRASSDEDRFGRDRRMILAGEPVGVVAQHPVIAGEDIHRRIRRCVADVRTSGDVRRRHRDDERSPRGIGLGVKEPGALPARVDPLLDRLGIVRLLESREPHYFLVFPTTVTFERTHGSLPVSTSASMTAPLRSLARSDALGTLTTIVIAIGIAAKGSWWICASCLRASTATIVP